MSQSRTSTVASSARALLSGDKAPRNRSSLVTSVEDVRSPTVAQKDCPNRESRKNKTKNKIPISVRCDLENALVDLCDSWFEDIKPHLVRNNIKLHMHDTGAVGACSSEDYTQEQNCYHLNPASSSDKCMLCHLLCGAAHNIESALYQAAGVQSLPESSTRTSAIASTDVPLLLSGHSKRACRGQTPCINRTYSTLPDLSKIKTSSAELFKSISYKGVRTSSRRIATVASQTDYPDYSLRSHQHETNVFLPKIYENLFASKEPCVLFQKDLINILGKRHDEILKNITKSPKKAGYPSLINLVSPRNCQKFGSHKKIPPWR